VDRQGFGRCLGATEVEASENPSRLAAQNIEPHEEAGYTSAVVTINQIQPTCCNRAGSIYIHTGHSLHKKMDDEGGHISHFAVKLLKWPMPIHRRLLS
jgi:hypothetical protein